LNIEFKNMFFMHIIFTNKLYGAVDTILKLGMFIFQTV